MSFFDLGLRLLRFQNYNLFFSETVGSFETQFHKKAEGRMEMKTDTNELSHFDQDGRHAHI